MMGEGWVGPTTFRFGASGLLDALEAAIAASVEPRPSPVPASPPSGY